VGVKCCCRQQKEAEPGVGLRGLGLGYQSKGFSTRPGRNAEASVHGRAEMLKKSISWPGEKLGSEIKPWGRFRSGS